MKWISNAEEIANDLPERREQVDEGTRATVEFNIGSDQLFWGFSQCLFHHLWHQDDFTTMWGCVGVSGYFSSLHWSLCYNTEQQNNQRQKRSPHTHTQTHNCISSPLMRTFTDITHPPAPSSRRVQPCHPRDSIQQREICSVSKCVVSREDRASSWTQR